MKWGSVIRVTVYTPMRGPEALVYLRAQIWPHLRCFTKAAGLTAFELYTGLRG
jgi:hypothetical protein